MRPLIRLITLDFDLHDCVSACYIIILFRIILNVTNNHFFSLSFNNGYVYLHCCHRAMTQTTNLLIIKPSQS